MQQDKQNLDGMFEMLELGLAVKSLKNNKAPGTGGIPIDFYKMFWKKLKFFFLDLIKEIMQEGQFHLSARRGIVTLLEKIGKNPLFLANWRPITLLCSDLKIFDKILARQLQSVLWKLIHKVDTQKNKQIGENVLKLLSLIDYCEDNGINAILVTVDFHKAFDSISWTAVKHTLKIFNFGEEIIKIVEIIYTNIVCTVMNNGKWLDWFPIQRGCQQGSQSFAILFILTVELLGLKLRHSKIQGLNPEGELDSMGPVCG